MDIFNTSSLHMTIPAEKDIPAIFPGPLSLTPSGRTWWRLILFSGCFTFLGILMISDGGGIKVWLATAFCGAGTLIGTIILLPGSSSLRLYESGFEITKFYRSKKYNWSDTSDFGVWSLSRRSEMVVFKLTKARFSVLDKINTALASCNGYLPDTYGLSAGDLANLMNTWHDAATRQCGAAP